MIKLYNPFKPHIIANGEFEYMVRKYYFEVGWCYLDYAKDRYRSHYWSIYRRNGTKFTSIESAESAMQDSLNIEKLAKELHDKKNTWRKV